MIVLHFHHRDILDVKQDIRLELYLSRVLTANYFASSLREPGNTKDTSPIRPLYENRFLVASAVSLFGPK